VPEAKLWREVSTIRARSHEHIVRFFAGFIAGREDPFHPEDPTICLHLLYEYTPAGTMKEWLNLSEAPPDYTDDARRHKFIFKSIRSLVSAVGCIHTVKNDYIGYHHDLKPENILLFNGNETRIWKICDFGLANLKHYEMDSGTTKGPENRFGTHEYQPPEYCMKDPNVKHGRPFDVYSLGCILLELAIIWVYGWKLSKVKEFRDRRSRSAEEGCFKERKTSEQDNSFHNSPKAVNEWVNTLRQSSPFDKNLWQIFGLIEKMLVERARRIWEVYMYLFEMEASRTEKELKEYLANVVQLADASWNELDQSDKVHNPLQRAIENGKTWQVKILENNNWSVDDPETSAAIIDDPGEQSIMMDKLGEPKTHSNLDECPHTHEFEQRRLVGRHDLKLNIANGLRVHERAALYGLSGIGYVQD
jgi:serine/threonine protein kinase